MFITQDKNLNILKTPIFSPVDPQVVGKVAKETFIHNLRVQHSGKKGKAK